MGRERCFPGRPLYPPMKSTLAGSVPVSSPLGDFLCPPRLPVPGLRHFRDMKQIDPERTRLPIKLDATSNGEFVPVPLDETNRAANRLAHEQASAHARRRSLTRRRFLTSACGAASTLLAFNAANAAAGRSGGFFDLHPEAALDDGLARVQVGAAKDEFIFDVQGHFIDTPKGNSKSAQVFV